LNELNQMTYHPSYWPD